MTKRFITSILGVLVAFLAGILILRVQGYPPLQSYTALFSYSLGGSSALFATLDKVTPLILAGLSASVAFASGAVNLGQPGQYLVGAIAVTVAGLYVNLPPVLMIPFLLAVALASGALYAGVAALLRRRFGMDEFITSLMLNFIADYLTLYLINGPMWDKALFSPMSKMIHESGWLPSVGGLNSAFFLAVLAFGAVWFVWSRSKWGYELKAMGQNSLFARIGGCRNESNFTRAMLLSGALAGLAGAVMVMGGMQHRFVKGIGGNYAWDGVMIAMVANNGIAATGLYALFFAALQTGAMGMNMETSVPPEFVMVLQAITVLFVVASRESTQTLINRIIASLKARRHSVTTGAEEGEHASAR